MAPENAGAVWVDQQVVNDRGLITSRQQFDIPAFAETLIWEIRNERKGEHWPEQAA